MNVSFDIIHRVLPSIGNPFRYLKIIILSLPIFIKINVMFP